MHRPRVLQHFASHDWVASVGELDALGVSVSAIARARRAGLVAALCPSVVSLASAELTFRGKARAAQLAAGPGAFVSGMSAGVLHGLRSMPDHTVEVTVDETYKIEVPTFARVVRTSWIDEERDIEEQDGLRVATPLRMLFKLARDFNDHRFARAAEDVWHLGLVTPEQAADYLALVRRSGRTGVLRMETWLERTAARRAPSQSNLERRVVEVIERLGLPAPERQHPLTLPSGEVIHLDIAWPNLRLAFEPGHTWWHGGDLAQRRDAARDQDCAVLGWAVHRFDEVQVADPRLAPRLRAIYLARRVLVAGSADALPAPEPA